MKTIPILQLAPAASFEPQPFNIRNSCPGPPSLSVCVSLMLLKTSERLPVFLTVIVRAARFKILTLPKSMLVGLMLSSAPLTVYVTELGAAAFPAWSFAFTVNVCVPTELSTALMRVPVDKVAGIDTEPDGPQSTTPEALSLHP